MWRLVEKRKEKQGHQQYFIDFASPLSLWQKFPGQLKFVHPRGSHKWEKFVAEEKITC